MNTLGRQIQLYRGNLADLPVLLDGEPACTTDTNGKKQLWIGSPTGNQLIQAEQHIIDDLVSNDPNASLSARQGKILKDLIDAIGAGGSSVNVVDNLLSDSPVSALSARMGKILNQKLSETFENVQNELTTHLEDNERHVTAQKQNNWNYAFDNTYNGGRLGEICKTITDWHSATKNGWYMGSDILNSPPGHSWFIGTAITHMENWVVLRVIAFTDPTRPTFEKTCLGGVWTDWEDVTFSRKLPTPSQAVFSVGWSPLLIAGSLTYYKDQFGVVNIYGRVKREGGTTTITVMPIGFRPTEAKEFIAPYGATMATVVVVNPDGTLYAPLIPSGENVLIDVSYRTN